ncbi:MAG: ATP synthase F1 subunit gamma [Acidobacteria bacterium]|nr:ATP synthase F1 subunit gamma [Acidobacteriota bacterium]
MANLIDIRRRIRSVQNTRQITRAMKFVSAAKLKKAQNRIFASRPYTRRMFQLINHLAVRQEDLSHPLMEERGHERILLVLITGDKGLCGSFNANLIRRAQEFMEEQPEAQVVLDLIGKKGYDHFHKRHYEIFAHYVNQLSEVNLQLAEEIARPLMDKFLNGEVDRIFIIYNEFKSAMQQNITVEQLLPIAEVEFEAETDQEPPVPAVEFIYEQPREEIFEDLFPRHVIVQIFHALLESVASEYGARMAAMDLATKNAGEMINRLVLFRNRVRQAAITNEIIEIVSGANAL